MPLLSNQWIALHNSRVGAVNQVLNLHFTLTQVLLSSQWWFQAVEIVIIFPFPQQTSLSTSSFLSWKPYTATVCLQPAPAWLLKHLNGKKTVGAKSTKYPINVTQPCISTEKMQNLLLTFTTLWPCLNQVLLVQLMHFCALSSACSYFFPSFLLAPDAPVFVEKQAQRRKR